MLRLTFATLLFLFTHSGVTQSINELYQAASKAKENHNYGKFLSLSKQALTFHPSHPALLHNLALGYILNNELDSGLRVINRNITYNAEYLTNKEPIFDQLSSLKPYNALLNFADSLSKTFVTSKSYVRIEEQKIHAEDLTKVGSNIFLTDIREGNVVIVDKNNESTSLIKLQSSGMAILSDTDNNLWVTSSMIPQYINYDSSKHQEAILYKISIKNRQISQQIKLEGQHILGSACMDNSGAIYFTDSVVPKIYQLNKGQNQLTVFMEFDDAFNLQGITYDSINNHIYVADYIKGIVRINPATKTTKWLTSSDFLLKGIDGLMKSPDGLIAIQNGSNPKRVIELHINDNAVYKVRFLDNNISSSGEPTNGKIMGKYLYYIANSPWPIYDKDNKPLIETWPALEVRQLKLKAQ